MEDWLVDILGFVAGACTTGSFVPQVVKAWRERDTGAISKRMYVILIGAFALWMAYGAMVGSWPLILFNLANLLLGAAVLVLKIRCDSAPEARADGR